ncbi:uncharacterized protein METZ01_LOCUS185065 [marine metagenome]|uniref:Uncharacterized protein n=1 Tax=marine metagenome TaxID=408172 RepID=A0A382D3C5_9ZZZZ
MRFALPAPTGVVTAAALTTARPGLTHTQLLNSWYEPSARPGLAHTHAF